MPTVSVEQALVKAPIKYPGGKSWLVPRLQQLFQPFRSRRLVEPFAGSAVVALNLQPSIALLGDAGEALINLHQWIKEGFEPLTDFENTANDFYKAREELNQRLRLHKRLRYRDAQIFNYLSRHCFNGLIRFNSKGEFNTPYGKYKKVKNDVDFVDLQQRYQNFEFNHCSYRALDVLPTDFVYADPPYHRGFVGYSKGGFSWDDQEHLAKWLSRHAGPVVASNYASRDILALYQGLGFSTLLVSAPRRISCNGDRDDVMEMLAIKNI